jgi:hypothetical protein
MWLLFDETFLISRFREYICGIKGFNGCRLKTVDFRIFPLI